MGVHSLRYGSCCFYDYGMIGTHYDREVVCRNLAARLAPMDEYDIEVGIDFVTLLCTFRLR